MNPSAFLSHILGARSLRAPWRGCGGLDLGRRLLRFDLVRGHLGQVFSHQQGRIHAQRVGAQHTGAVFQRAFSAQLLQVLP
jgi:hypothetical protein